MNKLFVTSFLVFLFFSTRTEAQPAQGCINVTRTSVLNCNGLYAHQANDGSWEFFDSIQQFEGTSVIVAENRTCTAEIEIVSKDGTQVKEYTVGPCFKLLYNKQSSITLSDATKTDDGFIALTPIPPSLFLKDGETANQYQLTFDFSINETSRIFLIPE